MGSGKGGSSASGGGGPKRLTVGVSNTYGVLRTTAPIRYTSLNRPVGVAFSGGRVFYFGLDMFDRPTIYFSQLMTDINNAGRCYQAADPTADEINDLVATDGGVMSPLGMGRPVALKETPFGLLCFCSNGVWVVKGVDGSSFSATSFQVGKITSIGCLGSQSIVLADDTVFYFAEGGLVQLSPDEFGRMTATDSSSDTIKSLYLGYSKADRRNAAGAYVVEERRVYWTMPRARADNTFKNDAQDVLILDLRLPGFYKWTMPDAAGNLLLPLELRRVGSTMIETAVTTNDGATAITTLGLEEITVERPVLAEGTPSIAFLAGRPESDSYRVSVAHPSSMLFKDFNIVDYKSFVEFGYQYPSSKATNLATPYIHSVFQTKRKGATYSEDGSYPGEGDFENSGGQGGIGSGNIFWGDGIPVSAGGTGFGQLELPPESVDYRIEQAPITLGTDNDPSAMVLATDGYLEKNNLLYRSQMKEAYAQRRTVGMNHNEALQDIYDTMDVALRDIWSKLNLVLAGSHVTIPGNFLQLLGTPPPGFNIHAVEYTPSVNVSGAAPGDTIIFRTLFGGTPPVGGPPIVNWDGTYNIVLGVGPDVLAAPTSYLQDFNISMTDKTAEFVIYRSACYIEGSNNQGRPCHSAYAPLGTIRRITGVNISQYIIHAMQDLRAE